jgi:pimeloyl-ACP methyl ester carboxylesterase
MREKNTPGTGEMGIMRSRNIGARLAAVAAVLFASCMPGVAAAQEPIRNIVLVHGAFADASSWSKVIAILQAAGYNVTAVQNPLSSLADDVAATQRALAAQDGPVLLVAHSWGCFVMTEAGNDPKVAGLVYIAGFAPDVGEVIEELAKPYSPAPALASLIVDKQGFARLSTDAVIKHFAPDSPEADARVIAATQGPLHVSAFGAKVTNAAWKTKPAWFIVAAHDDVISPDLERFFAKRMKAKTTELDSSHTPMLSQPKAVADVIMDAAANALPAGSGNAGR